jgi:hypothetical protein
VSTPGVQNLDTTSSAQTFTVSQTSGGTGITWSMTYMDGSAIPGSITLINPSNTIVTVRIAQTTQVGPSNFKIAATNIAGTTFTENFQISTFFYVAPIVNGIANFNNLDTTSGSSFVTATITDSGAAGPVTWSVASGPAGISINSSSGAISIAQFTIFGSSAITIRATNAAGNGDTVFNVIANIAPTLTRITSSPFNVNTYSTSQSLVQLSQTSGGTEIVWSWSASPATGRYSYPASGYVAPNLNYQTNTSFEVNFAQGAIYDGGTQGSVATITITAQNSAGSVSTTATGYAYPYIIYNWTSLIGPENWFGMFFPNKATNPSKKYSLYYVDGDGRLGVGNASNNQNLRYDYTTRRITYQGSGNVLRGYQNQRTTFENNTGNESRWVYVFPESGQTTVGWWYELSDGSGWRLNGGLSNGGDTQMYQEGNGDGNAQIQNVI